jgi:UDP-galactopyranose mutase
LARIKGVEQTKVLFWVSSPVPYLPSLLSRFPHSPVVFDWIDDVRLFAHLSPRVEACLHDLLRTADFVFTSGRRLHDQALRFRKPENVAILSNGVDVPHWRHPPDRQSPPPPMDALPPGPVIGYFGTISHWIDFELVAAVAKARPGWQFVFIGPASQVPGFEKLLEAGNIHWIKEQPYNRLPEFSCFFHAAWLPFRAEGLGATINPVKAYEYLAAGKPVVASPLPDLIDLEPAVALAKSAPEFVEQLTALLEAQDEAVVEQRRVMAQRYSWDRLWSRAEQRLVANIAAMQA